jgi:hypothetical protein
LTSVLLPVSLAFSHISIRNAIKCNEAIPHLTFIVGTGFPNHPTRFLSTTPVLA